MTFEVSHYFEKEVTWLLGNYYEYINKEAISKDRVMKAAELQAVLRGRKLAMGQREGRQPSPSSTSKPLLPAAWKVEPHALCNGRPYHACWHNYR